MKEWLRRNPSHVPAGLDATSSNSHSLRNGLRRNNWGYEETANEERLIYPGTTLEKALPVDEEATPDEIVEAAFALEHELQSFIANNLEAIDVGGKRLRLYVDERGVDGIEYVTELGRIDILAIDEVGGFYVFELKRATAPDSAMGQLMRYMGWVQQTIG